MRHRLCGVFYPPESNPNQEVITLPFWAAQADLTTIQWIIRGIVGFFWLLFVTKLMGQRKIAQMTLFDFVAAITIGSIAANPLAMSASNMTGPLITIGLFGLLNIVIAAISMKYPRARRVLQEEPIVLIKDGKLLEKTMAKTRYNLDDLMAELRQNQLNSLADVEFAVLEPFGRLSVIPKANARPARPMDFGQTPPQEQMPVLLIENGDIIYDNLKEHNLTEHWLEQHLKKQGLKRDQVFVAMLDSQGRIFISARD